MTIKGTSGDDNLVGTAGNDSFDLTQGGNDTVQGAGGNDSFSFGATFTAADHVDGGTGTDTLKLAGDYSAGVIFGATTLVNVETISLAAGFSYKLTTNDATVASGQSMTVDGSALLAANSLVFDGSAETNGTLAVHGGLGDDSFAMGAHFTALDRVAGGGGNDTLSLNGNYNIAFGGSTIRDIGDLLLGAGHNYRFTENDNNIAAGVNMTLDATAVNGANTFYWNGVHETDGAVTVLAGSGTVSFAGGAQADTLVMGANLSTDDRIKGEGGNDTVTIGGADYSIAMGKPLLEGIANLVMQGGFDYHITSGGGIAAGANMLWDASALGASDTLSLNFVKETLGSVTVDAGAGITSITGGQKADLFNFTTGFNAADHINGQAGNDRLMLDGDYSGGVAFAATTVTEVEEFDVAAGHSYALTIASKTVAAGAALKVDASQLGVANFIAFHGDAAVATATLTMIGGAGDDAFWGGAGADSFDLSHGGSDTAVGGAGNDVFNMAGALTAADNIDGGTGSDTVALNGDYSAGLTFGATTIVNVETLSVAAGHTYNLTSADGTVASGATLAVDASALAAANGLTFNGAAETNGAFAFVGGAGNDALTGGAQADSFDLSHGGNDTASGGGGNDVFNLAGTLTAADSIDGGAGADTLNISGATNLALGAATIANVETLNLAAGSNYAFTANDGNVAAGATLTVNAGALGAANTLTFNGAAESDGSFAFIAGAGNDALTGGVQADSFDLSNGGNDAASGGGGNDSFTLAAAFTAADTIDGGAGNDIVNLNGDYSAGLVLGAATLANVETLQLAAGHSYNLTTNDANVAAGQILTVDASALGAGNALTFNGSAETDGSFAVTGGAGNDTLNMGAAFTAADHFNGGAGADTLNLNGDYSAGLVFGASSLANIETLGLAGGHSYNLTINDANVAAGQTLTVDASALGAANTLIFNGSAETDGGLIVIGGAGNDVFKLGGTLNAADQFNGGAGSDTVEFTVAAPNLTLGAATLVNIETLKFDAGASYTVTTNDSNVAAGHTLVVDAGAMGSTDTLTFNGAAESDGNFTITAGAGNDVLTGGAGADSFDLTHGGNDTAAGGAGNDSFILGAAFTAADQIDGGTGSDTVSLNGDYSAGLTLGAATLSNVETLSLAAGHSYNLTTNDANVAAGQTLTVDASALGAANALTFNGSAETDGGFDLIGGAGNDTLTGGNAGNTFDLTHGGADAANGGNGANIFNLGAAFDANDRINGALGGDNTLVLNGAYFNFAVTNAMVANIGTVDIQGTNTASFLWQQTAFAPLTVDASAAGGSLSFDFTGQNVSLHFIGGALNTHITGGTAADTFDAGTGTDIFSGGQGNDIFNFDGNLTAADQVNGGTGADTLNLNGDYSAGVTFSATTAVAITAIGFAAGHDYSITSNDTTVASGATTTVDASALGAANRLTFNGAAETDGSFAFKDGAGNDTLTGGANADSFLLTAGGTDTAHGGGGNDTFTLGAAFNAADSIDGGTGSDSISLNGDYSAGVVFGAATLTNVETLTLAAGHGYNLTTNDATVASGQTLTVDGSTLGAGDALTIDGSAETDGSFAFLAGAGNDTLTGGAQADSFALSSGGTDTAHGGGGNDSFTLGAAFTAADSIDGGAGNDSVSLNGNYSAGISFGATTLTNVETLNLAESGSAYSLTTNDATVAAGQTLTVNAGTLTSALAFNGGTETDGSFAIIAGTGNDTLTGGAQADSFTLSAGGTDTAHGGGGNDTFSLGATLTAADVLDGGTGNDTVSISGDYSAGLTLGAATLASVETLTLGNAATAYTITTNDSNVAAGQTLTVDGSALTTALTFNGAAETNGAFSVIGGSGNDALTAGAGNDSFDISLGGTDTVHGGNGNDTISAGGALTTADTIDGGAGTDILVLNGDYSSGLTFTNAMVTNVEGLQFAAGHSYNITTASGTAAAGQIFTVDASALGAGDTLTFEGGNEAVNGSFAFIGGAGNDFLDGSPNADTFDLSHGGSDTANGGSGNDTFNMGAALDGGDQLQGNSGTNIVVLNGDYSAGVTLGASTLLNIQTLTLTGGHSYNLTTNDGNVAAAARLTVDASSLGAGDTFTFNGAAETDGNYTISDGAGSDTITGGGGNDTINITKGGTDTAHGGAGNDTIAIDATYTAADTIDGGAGTDTLFVNNGDFNLTLNATAFQSIEGLSIGGSNNSYRFTTTDDLVGAGQTFTVDASGMNTALTFDGSAETNGSFAITGSNNNDTITVGGVATTVNAGAGNDTIIVTRFVAADTFNGGSSGSDTLELNGDFGAITLTSNDLNNIGNLSLAAGHNYNIALTSSALFNNQALTVDGSALAAANNFTFDATQKGGGNALHVIGGAGDDTVLIANSFNTGDQYNGGSGNDTLKLSQTFGGTFTFNANTISNVDTIVVAAGGSYSLTLQEGNIASGQTLTVDGSLLDVNHALTVSTTQLSHGGLNFIGGAGADEALLGATADADTISGGGGNDTAIFTNLVAGDSFNGGAGNDTLALNGDFGAITLGTTMMNSVETLAFNQSHNYNVTLVDADVAAGQTLTVNASGLGTSDQLTFDDTAETDGILHITGGAGADTFKLGTDFTANTQLDGGGFFNNDTLILSGNINVSMATNTMADIFNVIFTAGFNYTIVANSDESITAVETVNASALGAGNSLHWSSQGFYEYSFLGGAGDDVISDAGFDDTWNMSQGGNDTVTGGNFVDTFNFGAALTAADTINGGSGNDVLNISGDYSAGLTFGATTLNSVETLNLANAGSYKLTMNDANVASGATLTISGSTLTGANALTFDGSAETDGFYKVTGGAGNDTFNMGAALKAGDAFNGGSGSTDTLSLNGDYSSLFTFASTTMTNIDVLQLAGGHSYDLSLDDANVASGALLTVNASALTAGDALTLGTSDANSRFAVLGGAGNDFVTFGNAMSSSSTFNGGAGFDVLSLGASASFTFSATTLVGVEKIQFTAGGYSLTTNDANVAAGQTLIVEASTLTASFTFNGGAETDGSFAMDGSQGTDTLTGGAQADTFTMTAGGSDTVHGGGGNDTINMGSTFATGDVLDGGVGTDTVQLSGTYTNVTFTAAEFTSIETLFLGAASSYGFTTVDANVASGATLTVDASALGAANTLTFNGGAETDGSFAMIGGAGNDTLTGGNQADTFDLTLGGADTVHGGGGNDVINMGNTLTNTDVVDGGTGTNTVNLSGNAYAALALGSSFTNIQDIVLGAGNSYGVTTADANVASGASLIVDASALGAANALAFNGAAETNGTFTLIDGAGNDSLTGGALGDTFTLSGGGVDAVHGGGGNDTIGFLGNFTAADTADGGAGTDTLILAGDYSGANALVLAASSMTGIEAMTLQNGFNYDITTADANIAAATTLTVTALTGAGHTVSFNGAAELDGSFAFVGGASDDSFTGGALADSLDMSHGGNDTVHGGGGNDSFTFGNAFDGNDSVDGGAGNDTMTIAEAYTGSIGTITNVETLTLGGGFAYSLTATDNTVAAGQTMTIDGSAALGFTFDGSAESDGAYAVTGGSGTNNFSGGNGNDSFTLITGNNDTVHGGGGDDTMFFSTNIATGTNTIDGGTGNDTLVIEIAELGNLELTGLTSVETVRFQFGDYSVYTDDATVAAGQTLTIDSTPLGTNESLTFDGSAETDGHFVFDDGVQGTLTLTGGALSDIFNLGGAVETIHAGGGDDVFYADNGIGSEDTIDGGAGNDTVIFNQNGGAFLFDQVLKSVETLSFADGHTYSVTLDSGSTPTGETMTIDAGAIVTGSLTFDASDVTSKLNIIGGAGNDNLTGGGGNDTFDMTKGGNDTVHAGTGLNVVNMGTTLNAGDTIVGGGDFDTTVVIAGDNYTSLALSGTLQDVGSLQLTAGHSYTITADNTTMSDNDGLLIDGGNLGATDVLTFTDTATIDFISVKGGAGNDVLTGSSAVEEFFLAAGGNDTVTGNGGADIFHAGATGTNTFVYNAVSDSTSTGYDTFTSLNFNTDILKLNTGNAVTGIDAAIASGFLSTSSFDSNLAGNVNSATLAAHHAVLFTATAGTLSGHTFLVVDQNGTAGYQASADLVFDVTGYSGTLTTADFI